MAQFARTDFAESDEPSAPGAAPGGSSTPHGVLRFGGRDIGATNDLRPTAPLRDSTGAIRVRPLSAGSER